MLWNIDQFGNWPLPDSQSWPALHCFQLTVPVFYFSIVHKIEGKCMETLVR